MREHPIPQDITGYRFHIVGNMTLKQFAEVGLGAFIAFLFYTTNLVAAIKWPLMGVSFALGAMAAFVPFEERPLDHWIMTFFRVLYKPTKYYWERSAKIPEALTYEQPKYAKQPKYEVDLTPARRQRIKEYLQSVRYAAPDTSVDPLQQQRINDILQTFEHQPATTPVTVTQKAKPRLKVRVRELRHHEREVDLTAPAIITEEIEESKYLHRDPLATKAHMSSESIATDIEVPETPDINILTHETDQAAAVTQEHQQSQQDQRAYVQDEAKQAQDTTGHSAVTFNQNLPFPTKPTQPNKLVGMVLTPYDELVNDAIIEIKTKSNGDTVRAVKTNALGQFFITTPLSNGEYLLEVEKPELSFQPMQLSLTGEIIDPVEIRSVV